MRINISIKDGAAKKLDRISSDFGDAMEKAAKLVENSAKDACPVDTGALQSSINVSLTENGAKISADKDYAAYVEFGTVKSAAQPFLVPALLNNTDAIISIIKNVVLSWE